MTQIWKRILIYTIIIIAGGVLLFILVETVKAKNSGFETKTLWDWMELLIIPLILAIGATWVNWTIRTAEMRTTENRAKAEMAMQEARAKTEIEIALDQTREKILIDYFDKISELILENKLREEGDQEIRTVVRARTLAVLRRLDGERKGIILHFLYEANLIKGELPIIDLSGSDFRYAQLAKSNFEEINLIGGYSHNR